MGYATQNGGVGTNYYLSNAEYVTGPLVDPPPRSGVQQYTTERLTRSGNNSPWTKGGIIYTPTILSIKYRAIISHTYVPRRRYYRSKLKNGKYVKIYYIIHVKKNIWGFKVRTKRVVKRTTATNSQVLIPNNLNFSAWTVLNDQGMQVSLNGRSGPDEVVGSCSGYGIMPGLYNFPGIKAFGVDVMNFSTPSPRIASWMDQVKPGLLSKLYSNAMSNYANVVNMLAEAGQTTNMVTSLLDSGIGLARSVKRLDLNRARAFAAGHLKDAQRLARDMSALWLSWVYGAAPLIDDIRTISATQRNNQQAVLRFRSSIKSDFKEVNVYNPGGGQVSIVRNSSAVLKLQVAMRGQLSIPELSRLSGASTPLATVWEVIPYSFILDQLYPLGAWLSDSCAFQFGVLSYHESRLQKTISSFNVEHNYQGSGYTSYHWAGNSQAASVEAVRFTRSVDSTPPAMPLPSFKLGGLTQQRMLNNLALFLTKAL